MVNKIEVRVEDYKEMLERVFTIAPELKSEYNIPQELEGYSYKAVGLNADFGFVLRDYLSKEAARITLNEGRNVVTTDDIAKAYRKLIENCNAQ